MAQYLCRVSFREVPMTALPPPIMSARMTERSQPVLASWAIVAIITISVAAVLLCVLLFQATGRDWWILLRDPAAAFKFPPSAGLFSHLGVLAMAVMGAICVFVALLLQRGTRDRMVLLYVGMLSMWLALDDLFMLHEGILPRTIGLPEHATLGLYVVLAIGLMRLIGGQLFTWAYLGLWVAAAFLVVMLGTDLMFEEVTAASFLVEEVSKLSGFMLWSVFWIAFAALRMRGAMAL
jgi:hypothetical protein